MMTTQALRDDLQEPGPIYVYEKGKLIVKGRRCKSLGDNPFPKRPRPESPQIRNYHQIPSGNGEFNVASLRSICIEFVAKNISIVESLVGFPDIVGSEIFKSVSRQGHLENYKSENVKMVLQLFTSSYKDAVMSDLDLSVFPRLMLENSLDVISIFMYLYKLDVSHQQLGDDHQLWKAVAEMENLTHLAVKNNFLSNSGLQNMTLPCRMFKRGPIKLEVLNLACNPGITDAGVRYLMCFQMLCDVDLSGTGIKTVGLQKLEQSCSLSQIPLRNEKPRMFSLREHSGWAADILNQWLSSFKASTEMKENESLRNTSPLLTASNFYNRRKSHQYLARSVKEQFPRTPCPSPEPQLRLVSTKASPLCSTTHEYTTNPTFSMMAHCDQASTDSLAMNLCMADTNEKENEPGGSDADYTATMSHYVKSNSPKCIFPSQIGSKSNLSTNKNSPNEKIHKKPNKFSVRQEIKGNNKCLDDNNMELLSEYSDKTDTSMQKSLWSAMNSTKW